MMKNNYIDNNRKENQKNQIHEKEIILDNDEELDQDDFAESDSLSEIYKMIETQLYDIGNNHI